MPRCHVDYEDMILSVVFRTTPMAFTRALELIPDSFLGFSGIRASSLSLNISNETLPEPWTTLEHTVGKTADFVDRSLFYVKVFCLKCWFVWQGKPLNKQ